MTLGPAFAARSRLFDRLPHVNSFVTEKTSEFQSRSQLHNLSQKSFSTQHLDVSNKHFSLFRQDIY